MADKRESDGTLIGFLCVHSEAIAIGLAAVNALAGLALVAIGHPAGWAFLAADVILAALVGLVVVEYRKWDLGIEENNRRVGEANLGEGEFIVELTPRQYEAYVKDGYVILQDGSPVISPKYMASGKMKHVKLEDYTALNGPFYTKENEGYDGERVLDYEEIYGKNYGKPVKEDIDGKK